MTGIVLLLLLVFSPLYAGAFTFNQEREQEAFSPLYKDLSTSSSASTFRLDDEESVLSTHGRLRGVGGSGGGFEDPGSQENPNSYNDAAPIGDAFSVFIFLSLFYLVAKKIKDMNRFK